MKAAIDKWDIMNPDNQEARARFLAAPGGIRTTEAFSQSKDGQTSTSTVSQVASVVPNMPILQMVVWPYCMAISQSVAAWLKPQALTTVY